MTPNRPSDDATEWRNEYMATPMPFVRVGDLCEYLTRRGDWVEARVLDYLIEDRPYYIIEYIDPLGRLHNGKARSCARSCELRPIRKEPIEYVGPPLSMAPKPKGLTGPLSQAWDYLVNCGGVCKTAQFDDDFMPAGPAMRRNLARFGVTESTSGDVTIVMLPE